ncbi:MAG: ATP-dependent helicase [Candidatus Eremiobacteraeota bacterium]|nr:ATP-dependent helicase [Candidatus Eremiobacteraeota bacterium]
MVREYILRHDDSPPKFRVNYREDLNPQQYEAVTSPGGPTLVLAGAGSGKTRTLIYRVAWLIEQGISPARIMLVTFTNRAAKEMMFRVNSLLKFQVSGIWGGTFHHVGNLLLRRYAEKFGLTSGFNIMDAEDTRQYLEECIHYLPSKDKNKYFPKGNVLREIRSLASGTMKTVGEILNERFPYLSDFQDEMKKLFDIYHEKKKASNCVDFDDLLEYWKEILSDPRIKDELKERFQHILVDEYQDTNRLQAYIVEEMSGPSGNLMVVGDDAQSIYSFRGAEFRNILEFPARMPDCNIYKLEANYRSTPQILTIANSSISKNRQQHRKILIPTRPSGEKPVLIQAQDPFEQAEFIAQMVKDIHDELDMPYSRMAVLYRAHHHSLEIQMELNRRGIQYNVRSGLRFFEQAHIKDVLSYLKIIQNPRDELSWLRVLKILPGIGRKTARFITDEILRARNPRETVISPNFSSGLRTRIKPAWAEFIVSYREFIKDEKPPRPDLLMEVFLKKHYDDYMKVHFENYSERKKEIEQLAALSSTYPSLEDFLSEISLQESMMGEEILIPPEEDEKDPLILSTIHRAKGLEWDVVFIPYLAEHYFPVSSVKTDEEVEEERRLFYVGLTRTKQQVYILYPIISRRADSRIILRPSRFIKELPTDQYELWRLKRETPGEPDSGDEH